MRKRTKIKHVPGKPFFCFHCRKFAHRPGGVGCPPGLLWLFLIINRKVSRESTIRNIKQTPIKSFCVFNLRVNFVLWDFELQDFPTGTLNKVGRVRSVGLTRPTALHVMLALVHCSLLHALKYYSPAVMDSQTKTKKRPAGLVPGKARPVLLFLKEHET